MKYTTCWLILMFLLAGIPSTASADPLRFATFNTYNFGKTTPVPETKADAVASAIAEINADIWAIQEIYGSASPFEQFLSERFAGLYDTVIIEGNSPYQVGIISKYPIVSTVDHSSDGGEKVFYHGCLEATIRVGEDLVTVIATHLKPGYDRAARNLEGHRIAEIIQSLPPDRPVVVMGDLNDVFSSSWEPLPSPVNIIRDAGLTAVPARNPISHSTATFDSTTPVVRYDYIFLSAQYYERITDHEVFVNGSSQQASDHLPVWAALDVEIIPEPASLLLWGALPVALWRGKRRRAR